MDVKAYPVFDRFFIDMVLGLPSSVQEIRPESIARKMLAPRTSTVFPVPCRQAVYEKTEDKQVEANVTCLGKKLTKQSLGILPKIRELDQFINEHCEYRNVFRESHPELCFSRLAGKVLKSKKAEFSGYTQRQQILSGYQREIAHIHLWELAKQLKCNPDDIVDALCLMVTANLDARNLTDTIPEKPQKDVNGILMRMVIPKKMRKV